jgi:HK97 family phage prohead protease
MKIVRKRLTAAEKEALSDKVRGATPPPAPAKQGSKFMRCDMALNMAEQDTKAFDVVKDGDNQVVDYRNVTIKGYLSTWQETTPSDREGDYVLKGAFTKSIPQFMRNPVLLVNHRNAVDAIAGKFTTVKEDGKGLYVEAKITDSPAEFARDIRWKVANGELRTLSMGGFFFYGEDGRAIKEVSLYEGSLTPIPANPDAAFSVRECTEAEMTKAMVELGE